MKLYKGDSLEVLSLLPDDSVDSMITDPPAGISFMGKAWDEDKGGSKQWIAWMSSVMSEALRVLKPGAHALVWAIPRTSHWTATALEDAGFEIRDVVTHLFGSGFPKSLDISKAIDKAAGAEREVIGLKKDISHIDRGDRNIDDQGDFISASTFTGKDAKPNYVTAPSTPEAKHYQGFGTALKPASEHWILCRKPLSEKTVAANVLKHGVGGINIDGCRVGQREKEQFTGKKRVFSFGGEVQDYKNPNFYEGGNPLPQGRFPANLVLDEEAAKMLDEQSGTLKSAGEYTESKDKSINVSKSLFGNEASRRDNTYAGQSGGASRFFYCAKSPKSERGIGNTHPTVKALKLMSYLIKLITPPGGIVLDPFTGSGSTGVAALKEGFQFIGIEKEEEYIKIAQARLEAV